MKKRSFLRLSQNFCSQTMCYFNVFNSAKAYKKSQTEAGPKSTLFSFCMTKRTYTCTLATPSLWDKPALPATRATLLDQVVQRAVWS